ncbi:hypothetical protein BGW38_000019 [Lunasporangiospora selenospora]|uniref:Elongation factor EFG domain-containing protein n=1 Tax=Lunasporangiospora selenospora TaxID=979761 RepID=A0A9P6G3X0_9FUNG|nr:hypothetical protein BGW38_000019 [Lunasporangiospora selenospora]
MSSRLGSRTFLTSTSASGACAPTQLRNASQKATMAPMGLGRAQRLGALLVKSSAWRAGSVGVARACYSTEAATATTVGQDDGTALTVEDMMPVDNIRNIAIIAHVDHGKTSLVDKLLTQSGETLGATRVMDSNTLERERGITILSKVTSVVYQTTGAKTVKINIVDASEGPMTQTKFVLNKALSQGLRPLVVINKVDRPTSRVDEVDGMLLDLFGSLGASDEQMDYPLIYASAKEGWAVRSMDDARDNMRPLLDLIVDHVPAPKVNREETFKMLVTQIDSNPYLGKCFLGKIAAGTLKIGDKMQALDREGKQTESGRVTKIFVRRGLEMIPVTEAGAGDIVTVTGVANATVNSTLCDLSVTEPLPSSAIDPPTIAMKFAVNDSPYAGDEGKNLTSNMIRDRLMREAETNVALQVIESETKESFEVRGRGELQLGVLIETMRREGFELSVSPPRVVYKEEKGQRLEPIEEVTIDVGTQYTGTIIEKLSKRKAELKSFDENGDKTRLVFECPTRGLLGYTAEFKNDTSGDGTLNHTFLGYEIFKGGLDRTRKGALVATGTSGSATSYALNLIEPRGKLFIRPGDKVYSGMVIGESARSGDLEVNPTRAKQVTNIRTVAKDENIVLRPPVEMSLESMISYLAGDEVLEVTQSSLRIRKRELDSNKRRANLRAGRE